MLQDVSHLLMQAAEQEAAQNKAKLGAWGVVDSFRVNHNHTEAAEFTHVATAKAVRMELALPETRGDADKTGERHPADTLLQRCANSTLHANIE